MNRSETYGTALDLSGRTAIVTGAASGIGRAAAIELARAGARTACADINGSGAQETAQTIVALGGDAHGYRVDVSSAEEVDGFVGSVVARMGSLDIMCNVAGIMDDLSVLQTTAADLDRVWDINFKGVLYGCQSAVRVMQTQGSGSIINMASTVIDTPKAKTLNYAVSKAAIATLTATLAIELGASGIRVNAVAPGFISTAITERHFLRDDDTIDENLKSQTLARMADQTPLGRVGEPIDIAQAMVYLASDASGFLTGQVMRVNGGLSMR